MRPLRVPDQHDLLARTRGDLRCQLRRQRGRSGGGGAGVVEERRGVHYDGGADALRAVLDNGADQGANDTRARWFAGGARGNDVHGRTGSAGLDEWNGDGERCEGEDGEDYLLHDGPSGGGDGC